MRNHADSFAKDLEELAMKMSANCWERDDTVARCDR